MLSRCRRLLPAWIAAALLLCAVEARPQSRPDPVQALFAYAGLWHVDIQHLDTPYSKSGHETTILRNDCWKSGQYVACRQIVNGDSRVLIVFTCIDAHNCTSYQVPPGGGDAGSGKLAIDGNTWIFPWSTTEHGKTTWFRVVNVWSSRDTIEYRQEFSTDQQHWTAMATGHESRVQIGRMPTDPLPRPK